jgi:hypothetical protein
MKLEYKDFRPIRKGENGYSKTARRYISHSTGVVISKRQFTNGAYAPIRTAPQAIERISNSSKKISIGRQRYEGNAKRFAEQYGLTAKQAKQSGEFKFFNKEFNRHLKRKARLEEKIISGDYDQKTEEKLQKTLDQLADNARSLGIKRKDDFTQFGTTPTLT